MRLFVFMGIAAAVGCGGGGSPSTGGAPADLVSPCTDYCQALHDQCSKDDSTCLAECECQGAAKDSCRAAFASLVACAAKAVLLCTSGLPGVLCKDELSAYQGCNGAPPTLTSGMCSGYGSGAGLPLSDVGLSCSSTQACPDGINCQVPSGASTGWCAPKCMTDDQCPQGARCIFPVCVHLCVPPGDCPQNTVCGSGNACQPDCRLAPGYCTPAQHCNTTTGSCTKN